ncbi:unnamed protein product [Arctia plantaginis]|uniref:RAP domain-containing protein n=1 Tax=Arctia plantaginis TaxID=874455 RepID=A0A8S1AWX5_ARCPL|nr:unnamed protein product [Arctia plantaginis]
MMQCCQQLNELGGNGKKENIMTLLLKNMWRSVLSGRSLNSSLRSRSFTSDMTEMSLSQSPDVVMTSIKTALSAADVLHAVQTNLAVMNHKHMLQAFRCLFNLQRACKIPGEIDHLVKDPTFGVLCQNFKKQARALDVNEAIEATKVLTYLKVPADSVVVQTMLQLIKTNINMISLRQIMFMDFLLTRFDTKNHLVDALKLALPLAFQIHLPIEIDNQDLSLLRDMLSYACSHDLPERCINNIVTGLLLHDQAIDAQIAKSIIWSLCQANCTEQLYPTRVQLLHICYDILTQRLNQLTYDEVLSTVARIKGRILEKHPEYYHEQLMDAVAQYMVKNKVNFEKSLLVARILSRTAHTNLGLVEYLCNLAASNSATLATCRTNILLGFINCLSNNNYEPEQMQWKEIQRQISKNPVLDGKNNALPWAKICLELASLGHYEDKLLTKVFSKTYFDDFHIRDTNMLDYLQLLTLHEAVRTFYSDKYGLPTEVLEKAKSIYPAHALTDQLEDHLAQGLGGAQYVVRNVLLPNGFVADCLICLQNGYPVQMPICSGDLKVPIGYLNLPAGSIVVCVMNFAPSCFSMNSNRLRGTFRLVLDILEKQGYATVPININEWLSAPPHERTQYLIREVGYKCGEIGLKLSTCSS